MAFTQPSTGWQSIALQAGKPISPPCQASPSTAPPRWRSLNCLFTICCGNPQFFIAINNWAVWSGHSTKGCSILSEAWGGGSPSSMSRGGDTHTLQHGGDLGSLLPSSAAVARSRGYISSSLSAQYNTPVTTVRGATCLCLLGHTTNSKSLALIELMFLFRGSCLVSLSLRFTLATSLSSHNLYGRLPGSDQLLVSSLSYIRRRSVTTAK